MLKRILVLSGLVVLAGSNAVAAKFPFGRKAARSTPARHSNQALMKILNDPVKMTERYGPSILVRSNSSTRFVGQPK